MTPCDSCNEDIVTGYYNDFNNSDNYSSYDPDNYDLVSDYCGPTIEQERTIKIFQTCVFCVIFLLGVAGNCLVIVTFATYRRAGLRSTTDVFLFHLALADLLLLLTLPLQAVDTHLGWVLPVALCKATRATYAINTYSGLLLLACISVDRYLVVARARQMLRLRRRMLPAGMVAAAGIWLAAVLLSLPDILFSGVTRVGADLYCGLLRSGGVKAAANGAVIGVVVLSLSVMVMCYSLIGRVIHEGHAHRGKQWRRQRTLRLMLCLVLVFLLFQLPYTVVLSRKMAGSFCGPLLEYVTCTLAYARCCVNPVLYALVGVRFRNDVLRLLRGSARPCGFSGSSLAGSSVTPSLQVVTDASSPTSLTPRSPRFS